jgi:PAS domain S-box-containing protein
VTHRSWSLVLAVAAAYAAATSLTFSWFGGTAAGATFFPAAGITVAALLLTGRRLWPALLLAVGGAEWLVDVLNDIDPLPSLGYAVANTVQPLVAALVLTARRPRLDLSRASDLLAFIVVAVVAAPVVGAVLGAATADLLAGGADWGTFIAEWWVGDGLGVLVVGGAILAVHVALGEPAERRRLPLAAAVAVAAAAATLGVLRLDQPWLAYLAVALLLGSGFVAGTAGAALTGAVVAVAAAQATAEGHVWWEDLRVEPAEGLLNLQLVLAVLVTAALWGAAAVAERGRAVEARARAERFQEMADVAPAMLWVLDTEGRIAFLSRRWSAFTGQPEREGLGSGWGDVVHPDDVGHVAEAVARATAAREPFSVEGRLRHRDGGYRWVISTGSPRFGPDGEWLGFVGSIVDVDAVRRAEHALADQERNFRTLFAEIDQGYCLAQMVLDDEGRPVDYRFLQVNPLFEAMTGLRDPVGRTALELVPGLERFWIERYARVALGGETVRFEEGSEAMGRWFDVFAAPAAPHGRFQVLFTDITERHRLDRELRDREEAARRGRARAEFLGAAMVALEAVDGVAGRAAVLAELLAPRVADRVTVHLPGEDPPLVAAGPAGGDDAPARSELAVPLEVGGGAEALMLLELTDPARRPYDAGDEAFVRELAARAGLLMAAARVLEDERRVALSLQRALLPEGPVGQPGLEIAARYTAAADGMEVGGDWYDVLPLPGGRVGLAVGDVVGHGLEAAACMGRLRTALAALAQDAAGVSDLMDRLRRFADGPAGVGFATACYAVLDPATGELEHASAGHPPMLLVAPDGSVRWLGEARGVPFCGLEDRAVAARTVLEPGATLMMFSDGLIERRRRPLALQLDRLAAVAAAQRGRPAEEACASVVEGMTGGEAMEDDVVLLCVRLAPSAAGDDATAADADPTAAVPATG